MTPLLWLGTGTDSASVSVWLPLVHLLTGGTGAAIDLCSSNIQMSVVPSPRSQATYFAIAAAIAGVTGAIGTAAGGFLAQVSSIGGLPGLFALSAMLRLLALLPLILVREHRSVLLVDVWREAKRSLRASLNLLRKNESLAPSEPQALVVQVVEVANRSK